jgi:hypothetical protein
VPLVFLLLIARDARRDLDRLWESDPTGAALLRRLLQQIAADQRLLDALTIRGFGAHRTAAFHVDQWIEQQRLGRNLWRLKHWDLEGQGKRYRVVYALDPRVSRYYVLGVFPREFNYESKDERTRRVIAAYEGLGIPTWR